VIRLRIKRRKTGAGAGPARTEEISEWTGGSASVDGDVLMKARTLAMQRGFEI
jgi:hypothetical protein